MKKLYRLFGVAIFFMSSIAALKVAANAAQPGVWNAGGTVFTMLYPEDSVSFKKVQMQDERIYIQLYKGYAVVKGIYQFRNTSNEKLNFKMGYPVNGIYSGGSGDLNEVTIDSLSRFIIKAKNKRLPLLKETHEELRHNQDRLRFVVDNWIVWEMIFEPEELQTVEVYFIVNTNEAQVRQGYNVENRNAFIYLLESGSVWQQPIRNGNFYIQLMDGLGLDNINGISDGFSFRYNEKHKIYAGEKVNFSPTPKDNLVLTYFKHNEQFEFEKIVSQSDTLFSKVDALSQLYLETVPFNEIQINNPYETEGSMLVNISGLIFQFVVFAPFIIGFIIFAIAAWAIIKWIRIRKSTKRI